MRYITLILDDAETLVQRKGFVARCIAAAILLSHDIRKDVVFRIYIRKGSFLVSFKTARLRNIRSDEQSVGGILEKVYKKLSWGKSLKRVHSGVVLSKKTLSEVFKRMPGTLALYESIGGKDLRRMDFLKVQHVMYVISEKIVYTENEIEYFKSHDFIPITVSRSQICVDARIVLFNNEMDRRGL